MLPQDLVLKMTREPPHSQQEKKATQEMHMEEVSKLVPAHVRMKGNFSVEFKGSRSRSKGSQDAFHVKVPATIRCLYTCS